MLSKLLCASILSTLLSTTCYADFFCEDEVSETQGNVMRVCGRVTATTLEVARERSYESSVREFEVECDNHCRSRVKHITSLRSVCKKLSYDEYECYRMIRVEVSSIELATSEHSDRDDAQELQRFNLFYPVVWLIKKVL
jgi:hypothetical protein